MGSQVSNQVLDTVSTISTNISNTAINTQGVSTSASNAIVLENCNDVKIDDAVQINRIKVDTQQYTNIVQKEYSAANIKQSASQAAAQIKGILDLSSQETNETEKLVSNILTAESNSFETTCKIANSATNAILCTTSNNDTIYNDTQENFVNSINSCITNDDQVSDAVNALQQFAKQKSTQVQLGLFGPLYAILLLVALIVIVIGIIILAAVFGYFSEGSLTLYLIIVFGLVLLSAYFVIAFFPKWWPYQFTNEIENSDIITEADKHNKTIFYTSLGLMVLFMVFFIVLIIEQDKKKSK